MDTPSDAYLKALEAAKRELVEVTAVQERLEKRKIALRKAIEVFSGLTAGDEDSGFSVDAVYLIENKALPDEIRNILKSLYPAWVTPNRIMTELKQMGRDLSKYSNPQSAIQTILKRMTESSDDPTEEQAQADGKKAYRCATLSHQLAEAYGVAHRPGFAAEILGNDVVDMIRKQEEGVRAAFKEQQERIAEMYKNIVIGPSPVEVLKSMKVATAPMEIGVLGRQINDAAAEAYRLQFPPRDVNPKKK